MAVKTYTKAQTKKWRKQVKIKAGEILPPDTKSVLIGYKEPLTPIKDGFGYYGTLAYNEEKTHTQCFICGYFFKNVGAHVRYEHDKKTIDYKLEYGLGSGMSIVAPVTRQKYTRRWETMTDEERTVKIAELKTVQVRYTSENKSARNKSLHKKNLEGRCPAQLLDKILAQSQELGRAPSYREFSKKYGGGYQKSVVLTFGTWLEALRILNLTPKSSSRFSYDKPTLIKMLQDFELRNERLPYATDLSSGNGLPSCGAFIRHFGSWSNAKEEAFGKVRVC
jgi:hypothetical protein